MQLRLDLVDRQALEQMVDLEQILYFLPLLLMVVVVVVHIMQLVLLVALEAVAERLELLVELEILRQQRHPRGIMADQEQRLFLAVAVVVEAHFLLARMQQHQVRAVEVMVGMERHPQYLELQ
jgi:hypothetical protein